MNWRLEVVVVPVSDVDRAKAFYAEKVGFNVDHDSRFSDELRVVQLTPPGSGSSIVIGKGIGQDMLPGSIKGLQLVVSDLHAARFRTDRARREGQRDPAGWPFRLSAKPRRGPAR
jgi:catechol 2,3-dioxygenase-like lactoylglutathione lyase family enzyme